MYALIRLDYKYTRLYDTSIIEMKERIQPNEISSYLEANNTHDKISYQYEGRLAVCESKYACESKFFYVRLDDVYETDSKGCIRLNEDLCLEDKDAISIYRNIIFGLVDYIDTNNLK